MSNIGIFKVTRTILVLIVFQAMATSACTYAGGASESGGSIKYTWQMPDTDAVILLKRIKLLRYGDDLPGVKESLGTPELEQDNINKNGNYIEHELCYAIKKVRPEGGNVMDQEISLSFDRKGRLFKISYNAMQPLSGEVILSGTEPQSGTVFYITKPPMPTESE